jgi:hypothetical protein
MRQKVIRAAKEKGSQGLSVKTVSGPVRRQQSTDSPKQRRPDPSSNYKPIRISQPLPTSTNRRGLVNWSRWDGKQWDITSIWAYHQTSFVFLAQRTHKKLRDAQSRSLHRTPKLREDFWTKYYRASYEAIMSLQSLNAYVVETMVISFLLRTAPNKIYRRFIRPGRAIDLACHEIAHHMVNLLQLRRIRLLREHTPMYFDIAVQQYRSRSRKREIIQSNRLDDKKHRMHTKYELGPGWSVRHGAIRHVRPDSMHDNLRREDLNQNYSGFPPRWTVSPLINAIEELSRDVYTSFKKFELVLSSKIDTLLPATFIRTTRLLQAYFDVRKELSELQIEMNALRCYRMHRFPDGFSEEEIKLGKRLWQQRNSGSEVESVKGNSEQPTTVSSRKTVYVQLLPKGSDSSTASKTPSASSIHMGVDVKTLDKRIFNSPKNRPPGRPSIAADRQLKEVATRLPISHSRKHGSKPRELVFSFSDASHTKR